MWNTEQTSLSHSLSWEESVQFLNTKYDIKLQNFIDAIYQIKKVTFNLRFAERFNQDWMLDFFQMLFLHELR